MTTNMAASCSWVCGEEATDSEKAVLVQFSNGSVKDAGKLDFTMYKNTDETNPRKKRRRMLVAETARLSYVGANFGDGSLKCNNLCQYYVGVLDKQTMQMEVHSAQLFNMHPVIPGETTESANTQDANQSYRDKVDSLIEAFGTSKQKKALSSRRMNQVGNDILQRAVSKAANSVIDQKGLDALQEEVAETETQAELVGHLPPCNANAERPEDVYPFDDLLSAEDLKALEQAGSKMAALPLEELQKMREGGRQSVARLLETLPAEGEARDKRASCAFYLSMLLKMAREKSFTRKLGQEEGCPRTIITKLMNTFSVETYNNGRVNNMVSSSMRIKIASYCVALLLHMGHLTVDLTLLHRDLGIPEAKMVELAKTMGLTLSKQSRGRAAKSELQDEHREASLELPLVKYDKFVQSRKRKKMR